VAGGIQNTAIRQSPIVTQRSAQHDLDGMGCEPALPGNPGSIEFERVLSGNTGYSGRCGRRGYL